MKCREDPLLIDRLHGLSWYTDAEAFRLRGDILTNQLPEVNRGSLHSSKQVYF